MTASYPNAYRQWTTKRNFLDIVWAEHMNSIQEETEAVQKTLGVIPQKATSNPGGLTPDHTTVAARIQSVARGEQVPFFRGSAREFKTAANVWNRPAFRADDDPLGMSTGTGVRLCETGLWMFTLKADWKSTSITTQQEAVRMIRLEINGNDVGVRNVLVEGTHNRAALHNALTWSDTFAKNTVVSLGVRTDCGGAPGELTLHAYLRAHLIRCHTSAGDGGSIPFEDVPDVTPGPGNVITPPDDVRKFTVLPCQGEKGPELAIIDNTHGAFRDSWLPAFNDWQSARAYRNTLAGNLGLNQIYNDTLADVGTGTRWPST